MGPSAGGGPGEEWEVECGRGRGLGLGFRYRGTYCGQDVAIKILKSERLNDSLQQEFAQEVYIMRCAHR